MPISPQLIDPETRERKYLDRAERQAFLEATKQQEAKKKYYCQLLYYTGCRLSEALEVSYDKLNFEEGFVQFRTLKQKKRSGTPAGNRFNELPASFLNEIQGFYATVRGRRPHAKASAEPLWPISDRQARNYVTEVMAAAGITGKKASSRGLRHSMGVMLAIDKVPVNVIQEVLGHASIRNTMIYLDIVGDERRQMVSQTW
jgi:site-specific recombinase XerD